VSLKKAWLSVVIVGLVVAAGLVSRLRRERQRLVSLRISRQVMGTFASLEAVGKAGRDDLRLALEDAWAALVDVENLMSPRRSGSTVCRINASAWSAPVRLDEHTRRVLDIAGRIWQLSDGAFDVTCGPLIALWKRCAAEGRLPSEAELEEVRRHCSWRLVRIESRDGKDFIRVLDRKVRIDLGGVAKGYGIDLAVQRLRRAGCAGGLVDVGGDLRAFGRPADEDVWLVAVRDPFEDSFLLTLKITDQAVCTSGNYYRYVRINGKRYSHIVDPRTGWPADACPSVTVIGPEAATTDALATALSVLGPDEGLRLIERLDGYEALFVVGEPDDFRMIRSSGFDRYVLNEGVR